MRKIIIVNGAKMHLILGKTKERWESNYGKDDDLWDILFEEFLDGSVEVNEEIWYYYIDGRCYETNIQTND